MSVGLQDAVCWLQEEETVEPLLGSRRAGRRGEACLRLLPCSDTDTVSSGAAQLDMLKESHNQLRGGGASCV